MGCRVSKGGLKHNVAYDGCFDLVRKDEDHWWWYMKIGSIPELCRHTQRTGVVLWHDPSSRGTWMRPKRVRAKEVAVCYLGRCHVVTWCSTFYVVLTDGKLYVTRWSPRRKGLLLRALGDAEIARLKNTVPTPPAADMVTAKRAWLKPLLSELMAAACSPDRLPQIMDLELLQELGHDPP